MSITSLKADVDDAVALANGLSATVTAVQGSVDQNAAGIQETKGIHLQAEFEVVWKSLKR